MKYGSNGRGGMSAGKIKGGSFAGNTGGSNVMLRKNTASSTPTQTGSRDLGASIIRVPNNLRSRGPRGR